MYGLYSASQTGELSQKLIEDTLQALNNTNVRKSKLSEIKEQMKKAFSGED